MAEISDYRTFDRPEILRVLFYPRPDWSLALNHCVATSLMVPVADGVQVQVQAYLDSPAAANIIFFHGNGEIASDYQDIAPFYTDRGINFLIADYRGYGVSSGIPTVSAMMMDCLVIFDHVKGWLREKGFTGLMIVMGRSLGSASALEIAHRRQHDMDGLIIESGFARELADAYKANSELAKAIHWAEKTANSAENPLLDLLYLADLKLQDNDFEGSNAVLQRIEPLINDADDSDQKALRAETLRLLSISLLKTGKYPEAMQNV